MIIPIESLGGRRVIISREVLNSDPDLYLPKRCASAVKAGRMHSSSAADWHWTSGTVEVSASSAAFYGTQNRRRLLEEDARQLAVTALQVDAREAALQQAEQSYTAKVRRPVARAQCTPPRCTGEHCTKLQACSIGVRLRTAIVLTRHACAKNARLEDEKQRATREAALELAEASLAEREASMARFGNTLALTRLSFC